MKISIITVVKNDEKKIVSTLRSVRNQNYNNYEHIVIDGKSTDQTLNLIKKFKNNKLKLISKIDNNLYQALNRGIKMSSGQYVGILHSGDKFMNNLVLKKISKAIKNYDCLFGNIIFEKNNKPARKWNYKIVKLNKYNAFKIAHTSLFLKKQLLLNMRGYSEKYHISSDTELILRLSNVKKLKYFYLNEYITIMSQNGLSTSFKNLFIKMNEDLVIYYKYFGFLFIFNYIYKITYKLIRLLF